MHAVEETARQVIAKVGQWKALTERAHSGMPGGPDGSQVIAALAEVKPAAEEAREADAALAALIRADLALKPSDADGGSQPADSMKVIL
jgi:hypothetical protein